MLTWITPAAANQLVRYGWPGNVREIENAMERAAPPRPLSSRHGLRSRCTPVAICSSAVETIGFSDVSRRVCLEAIFPENLYKE
jgi:transcriptional regulator with GAF, ATPase, and Fis domain